MTPALGPTSRWVKDIRYSRSNYERDLMMVRSPLSTPFGSAFLSPDNPINPSWTEPYNNWETHSSRARSYSSDTSLRNSLKPDKKSSMPAVKSTTHNKSKCWPAAPSPPLDKQWTPPSIDSSRPGPTTPSTLFYFIKPFGMLATTRQWSIHGTTSIANYRREDDRRHRVLQTDLLLPLTLPTFWHSSTTHLCGMCMTNPSPRMEGMMTATTSEVAVFMP